MLADARPPGSDAELPHLELVRESGRLPLGFVSDGADVLLIARDRSARWPTEILRDGAVELAVGERQVRGAPELVTDPDEKQRATSLFRAKYGAVGFEKWYSHPARIVRVVVGDGPPSVDPPGQYRRWLEAEFDNVADDYDRHITGNRVNRLLRDRSLAELRRAFRGRHRLLEIGCGSGMETLPLLEDGHELVCVDLSARMLDVVRAKARAAGRSEALTTFRSTAGDLSRLTPDLGEGAVDGAYSTYGALNCEAHLDRVALALGGLLPAGAPFVAGVYNRWCLFELAGYGLTGRLRRAFGRTGSPVPVGASRFCVDVFAYSWPEFRRRFAPWFEVRRVEAVPVLLPPSDLAGYADRFDRGWAALRRLDAAVGQRWPFFGFGDHFLATFARRAGPSGAG